MEFHTFINSYMHDLYLYLWPGR